ncbi:TPA: YraN family protein [Candidatus Gracilibacteria bacterium]|nr:YraN family protein [Candidatus Peregrinibacteria bacterium]HIQ56442.1 YraN family protein [Candidatus Gracilibacteria bacterium]HIQ57617.1 YraN family protein [Candidatus Gracilibacteria bacterium]
MKNNPQNHRQIGDIGENQAVEFLEKLGYRILQQNFCIRGGEIDIIAKDGEIFIFVEVKTRNNQSFGIPEESISPQKLKFIQRSISLYLKQRHLSEFDTDFRIDLIAIESMKELSEIRHYKNAFVFDDF